jgi:hypothetical protein
VSRISNTQQARPVPNPKAIDSDSQQLDIGPIAEFADAIAEVGGETRDLPAEGGQPALAYLIEPSLRDHIRALPIIFAIEHHKDPAGIDPTQGLSGIGRTPRQAHPQNVHRSAEIGNLEACFFAHYRMAPVGTHDQLGANRQATLRGLRAQSGHASALLGQSGCFSFHFEPETRIAFCLLGDKAQEIPLRHQGDKPTMGRQMGKIGKRQKDVANLRAKRPHFLMGSLQEFLEHAELMHDFERRRMDRIAAEVAQEVSMFFENQDSDPGSGQQQCQHHPGGAPSDDAATDRNLTNAHSLALPRERSSTSSAHHAAPEREFSVT